MATSQELATYFLAFMNGGAPHQELISSISAGGSISNFEREVMASSDPRKLDFCTIAEATEIVAADPTKNVVAEVRGNGNLKTLDTDNPQIDLYGQWVRVAIASGQAPVAPAVIPHPAPLPVQPTGGGGGGGVATNTTGGAGTGGIGATPTGTQTVQTTAGQQTQNLPGYYPPVYQEFSFFGFRFRQAVGGNQTWSSNTATGSGSGFPRVSLWFGVAVFMATMFIATILFIKAITPPVGPLPPDVVTMPTPFPSGKAK